MKFNIFTDGGSRGNPGPAATGIVVKNEEGEVVKAFGKFLGKATNNIAEYNALIQALEWAHENKGQELNCFLDSELVVKQLNGLYKVKDQKMKVFFGQIRDLEKNFKKITYTHIPRSKNADADAIVNNVLDSI